MAITGFYAALLAVLFLGLSWRTIEQRRAAKVEIGDGQDRELQRRIRVHANFVEYAPFALILMALAENLGAGDPLLHLSGLALLTGRAIHAYGLSQTPHDLRLRVGGMILTFSAIGLAALLCLILSVWRVF